MPDVLQHGITPEPVAVAAADDHDHDHEPQIPPIDCHIDAPFAKQRARNVLQNDLHLTAVSLTRSSPPRRTPLCRAATSRRRVRRRDRQAITNDLLRSAVTDLEDELLLRIKKRRRLGNGAVKSASEVLAEQRSYAYNQSPSIRRGNMVVPLMDLVVNRRKSKLKTLLEEYDLVSRPRDRPIITLDYEDADFLDCWEPSTREDDTDEWEAVGEPLDPVFTYAEVV